MSEMCVNVVQKVFAYGVMNGEEVVPCGWSAVGTTILCMGGMAFLPQMAK